MRPAGRTVWSWCIALATVSPLVFVRHGVTADQTPDWIFHHGRVVTVDSQFRVHAALAIREGQVIQTGSNRDVLALAGPATRRVDLQGRMVLPGLIDSHTHPSDASMTEFDHPIPPMQSISEVLAYVRRRAGELPEGSWIVLRQVFITRLAEQRYPTRAELDAAAPRHPVLFATGPDASLNSLALKRSGIDSAFKPIDGGPGKVEVDPRTGEPTGILRSLTRYVKVENSGRSPTEEDRRRRLIELCRDYLANGITAIGDRDAEPSEIERMRVLRQAGQLPVRVSASHHVDSTGTIEEIEANIRRVASHPLRRPDPWLQIIGIKTYLDGGMLTGSAYMRQPWGISTIYGITDPEYRGLLFIPPDRLKQMVRATIREGMQFTAHSVGDGAVHALLDAYREVNREIPVAPTRSSITHSNFMSAEAVRELPRLGVSVDIQPAWLWLDTRTLVRQFGYQRLRYFQPLRSLFRAGANAGGGSDHMQRIGALAAVNPYHPFLGMWVTLTRQARDYQGQLHPEEALTREQAIRFYTRNNAYLLFRDREIGSLEPGKRADFIVIDRDLLRCPVEQVKETRVLETWVEGRQVFRSGTTSPRVDASD